MLFPDIKYVFLDRDGVINRKAPEGEYVANWRDFQFLPGVEAAIASLNQSGRCVIVVTNQRGISLGLYDNAEVETIHEQLQKHLNAKHAHIDAFYYCPHDKDQCNCRKPKTGLFERAFRDFPEASRANSLVIGDSISDIEAAHRLGLPSIFIQNDLKIQKTGATEAIVLASAVSSSLFEAVAQYLR
ncbi:HAD family hydrolase [Alloacidobacterium dinghuense]|uniref:D,D-heptose 1,7-bisphosphate phosphatase n=2 Tax=Alloacidobacterium dinghuense TaxID=2763107 RepID=A0A7G8BRD6_9BACT|nr:HAD family hydrolase [Alloacidobacterium dinghuense]